MGSHLLLYQKLSDGWHGHSEVLTSVACSGRQFPRRTHRKAHREYSMRLGPARRSTCKRIQHRNDRSQPARQKTEHKSGAPCAAIADTGRWNDSLHGCITFVASSLDGSTMSRISSAPFNWPASTSCTDIHETTSRLPRETRFSDVMNVQVQVGLYDSNTLARCWPLSGCP
jgi:hypothetical protein